MKLVIPSTVALLLLFATQAPASAASTQALVQKPANTQAQSLVEKTHWRGGGGSPGWRGYRYGYGYWPGAYYGYGYYPPVYGYYYRPYRDWGWGYGWGHRRWHRHW
jgi:hypothetical protein